MRKAAFLCCALALLWGAPVFGEEITLAWDAPKTGTTPTGYRLYKTTTHLAAAEMAWEGPGLTCTITIANTGKHGFYVTAYLETGEGTLEGYPSKNVFYRTTRAKAINTVNPVSAKTAGQNVTGALH